VVRRKGVWSFGREEVKGDFPAVVHNGKTVLKQKGGVRSGECGEIFGVREVEVGARSSSMSENSSKNKTKNRRTEKMLGPFSARGEGEEVGSTCFPVHMGFKWSLMVVVGSPRKGKSGDCLLVNAKRGAVGWHARFVG